MAKAMEQMMSSMRKTTPVDQPSGLLLDTVTFDIANQQQRQEGIGVTLMGMMRSALSKVLG